MVSAHGDCLRLSCQYPLHTSPKHGNVYTTPIGKWCAVLLLLLWSTTRGEGLQDKYIKYNKETTSRRMPSLTVLELGQHSLLVAPRVEYDLQFCSHRPKVSHLRKEGASVYHNPTVT